MNLTDLVARLTLALDLSTRLLRHLVVLRAIVHQLIPGKTRHGYENLALDLRLDIRDAQGQRAVLARRQRVRVLAGDQMAIRDVVWGEGQPIAHYRVRGARRLGTLDEGSRRVLLLGLPPTAQAARLVTVETRRLIRDGLCGRQEYCEALVERPTGRMAMTVLFPATRPPKEAHLVTSPLRATARRVPVRYAADGRPRLSWRMTRPQPDTLYSLRWSW